MGNVTQKGKESHDWKAGSTKPAGERDFLAQDWSKHKPQGGEDLSELAEAHALRFNANYPQDAQNIFLWLGIQY